MTDKISSRSLRILQDKDRLEEIADLDLFSKEAQTRLDRITEKAARELDLPIGLVSLVLHNAQYFASSYGIESSWLGEAKGTPIEWSFCRFAVEDQQDFVVRDATVEERVKDSPLVTTGMIGCYAGVPLITSRGHAIGTLCVVGEEPRDFEENELATLQKLAARAIEEIERSRPGEGDR